VADLPWKIYLVVVGLLIGGSTFFIMGFVDLFSVGLFEQGLGFTILGGLMLITGIYYGLKILAFRWARSPEER
jgi:hypothetical protein